MRRLDRRRFLQHTAVAAAALSLPRSPILGANDDLRVAVIGLRSQGRGHMRTLMKIGGVRLVALCDVDPKILAGRVAEVEKAGGQVAAFTDPRELMERDDVDAITIATPNHWHSLLGIWACQAGKDVYVEKPVSHNIWEGRQLVKAARAHDRIVSGGTQSRSRRRIREAVEWIQGGNLGPIEVAYGCCYKPRQPIGPVTEGKIPDGLDYDLWTGPAPLKPLRRQRLHYDWHWIYDTGNGDLGNQGIHQMDVARWFLGQQRIAPRVISIGGRVGYRDAAETPNTQIVYFDYEPAPLIFEVRGLPRGKKFQDPKIWNKNMDGIPGLGGRGIGARIQCEGGSVVVDAGGGFVVAYDPKGAVIRKFDTKGGTGHIQNFIDAVRARDAGHLTADIEQTHVSSALCHQGLASHRLGGTMVPEDIRERIAGDPLATERFAAMREHLRANEVNLDVERLALGPWLDFDPGAEVCTNHEGAAPFVKRLGREPYRIPEIG